ncbi:MULTISPECIES: hypothetical protein [unclassified Bradyrhizobium]|uniref:hypothetical protein n=1 Tax=unclassified Bradyrhizobium TaxID=2631580 RepID=UPI0033942360
MARAIEVMQLLHQRGLQPPTIACGYEPTFHPDEFLNAAFDVAVLGEAEETVCELSEHSHSVNWTSPTFRDQLQTLRQDRSWRAQASGREP